MMDENMKNGGVRHMIQELSKDEIKSLKGVAILFMIGCHLYNTLNYSNLYHPTITIGDTPLIYYISFLFDICVPIYSFCTGYAMYLKRSLDFVENTKRILKFLKQYWIILMLTCIVGIITNNQEIPGTFSLFLGNLTTFNISYVGAWWYVQTYILLLVITPVVIKLIDKCAKRTLFFSLVVYFISFYFRIMNPFNSGYTTLDLIVRFIVLLGTCLFPFTVGMLFYKSQIISKLRSKIEKNNIMAFFIILICLILHNLIKNMIVAPFIAILFIFGFSLINFSKICRRCLIYFGNHSTNLWLTHMQFYMIFTPHLVFCTQTVIGCFFILLGLCLITSYFINFMNKIIDIGLNRLKNIRLHMYK